MSTVIFPVFYSSQILTLVATLADHGLQRNDKKMTNENRLWHQIFNTWLICNKVKMPLQRQFNSATQIVKASPVFTFRHQEMKEAKQNVKL